MTVRKAGRARTRALIVPSLMSTALWVITLGLVLCRYWYVGLGLIVALSAAASTRTGEKWTCVLLLGARPPRLHQRHTLAPAAQVLLRHGVPPDRFLLLVRHGHDVDVKAVGERTVVVTRGLVEAVRAGRLSSEAAAAVIAHEVGVQHAGLTRHEPALMVLLAPWTVWLTAIAIMWGVAAAILPQRLMGACLVIHAGIGVWLGATEHPVMYLGTIVMAIVLATWRAFRSWDRARGQVGDQYLLQRGLADVYADLLTANPTDDYTRDRAVRLLHHVLLDPRPVAPTAFSRRRSLVT